jgi:mono/diheme cytochrome c family protein
MRSLKTSLGLVTMLVISGVASPVFSADDPIARGKQLYDGKGACASCHGATGNGDGAAAAALNPKPRPLSGGVFSFDTDGDGSPGTDTDLVNVIKNGASKYGGSAVMPGRADIADEDIQAIVAYLRTL